MKQRIRLTESDLHRIIKESINNILKENTSLESWYGEEDYNGQTGSKGQVRSYENSFYKWEFQQMAKELGYKNWKDAFKYWWSEVKYEHPWYWHDDESRYATSLFKYDGDTVEDIGADQLVITQYPPFRN